MELEKAVAHGNEYRKSYRDDDSRVFDMECRNHGGCVWCIRKRMYSFLKQKQATIKKIKLSF